MVTMSRARAVALATAVTLVALLTGCAGGAGGTAPLAGATGAPAVTDASGALPDLDLHGTGVRVAAVGDSLTAGGGRMLSDGLDANTWMTYARGDGLDYVGGWAKGGSTVEEQAAAVTPVEDVDVLVLMSGTNDVRLGVPFEQAAPSYDAVVGTIGAAHVVVAAIPPYDRDPAAAARYGAQLEAYVVRRGWTYVDPWAWLRDGVLFAPGTTRDGIHPTTAGYERLGLALREAALAVAGRSGTGNDGTDGTAGTDGTV